MTDMHNRLTPAETIAELTRQNYAIQKLLKDVVDRLNEMEGLRITEEEIRRLATRFAMSEAVRITAQKSSQEAAERAIGKAYQSASRKAAKGARKARHASIIAASSFAAGLVAEAALHFFF